MNPFGAIIAGGQSIRYGAPKALAPVGGIRIIDRVADALGAVCANLVMIANEPALFDHLRLPARPDLHPGIGALAGIHAAVRWAAEEGRPGVVAVACDMPFLSPSLLRRVAELAFGAGAAPHPIGGDPAAGPAVSAGFDVVVPESGGRRGVEPLCAAYGVGCLPAIEERITAGDHRMVGFHDRVRVHRIPLREVETLCDPEIAFMNVNTPEERDRAEEIARAR